MNIQITLIAVLALAGCKDSTEGKSGPSRSGKGAEAAGKSSGIDYSKIDADLATAKDDDDFAQLMIDCGQIEVEAAMDGNQKLVKGAEFNKHCGVAFESRRAKVTIAQSTPDKMSTMCLSSSMGLEDLIRRKRGVAELQPLLLEVTNACGL